MLRISAQRWRSGPIESRRGPDQLLINVSLYWFTRSGATAAGVVAGLCSTPSRSCGALWTRSIRWPTGVNIQRVVISQPWKSRSCWSMIFGLSSEICAESIPQKRLGSLRARCGGTAAVRVSGIRSMPSFSIKTVLAQQHR
jgi:hypothetical protein